eukprot:SAG22_NODE_947_length_6367_cov_23.437460_1_plen_155_part_00
MVVGSVEASLFAYWANQLMGLAKQETGEAHWPNWAYLRGALLDGDRNCGAGGGCGGFAAAALNAAAAEWEGAGRPEWGRDVHRAAFKHPILDQTAGRCLGDRRAPHGGDLTTVNVGHYNPADRSMEQTAGPSYRQVRTCSAAAAAAAAAAATRS